VSRRLPNLGAVRVFEAAARHLSFTKAAGELAVTPAAVSNQIRTLEEQLGVRLFWRTSRTVRLTRAGETLLAAAGEALDLIGQAAERIAGTGGPRMLTVTSTTSFAVKWLVPRLDRFRARHPDIDVRIDVSDRLTDFARDEAQVGIRFGSGVYPGLRADLLSEEFVFPVCSPRLLEGAHPLRRPDDLRHHTLLHVPWQMQGESWPDWRMWLLAAGVEGIDATRGIYFNETSIAIQAAIDGQGVALGDTSLVAHDLERGRLVRPFDLSLKSPSRFAYYVVAPRATADRPLVKAFRDWVLEEMRGTGGKPGP
jgi:LysR family transcriptional regulator, glycine cleavage system transcriptional activator